MHSKGGAQIPKKESGAPQFSTEYKKPRQIATIRDEAVKESSGLAASRQNPGVFWTHNDSGDEPLLYAFDETGKRRGTFRVTGAKNSDWEDLALFTDGAGANFLFIGDIGNNERTRSELVVYRVHEPQISERDADSTKKSPRVTDRADEIRLQYPDARRDAETLLVHPETGDLYIVSKSLVGDADVYKLSAPFEIGKTNTLKHIGKIGVPSATSGFLTGGSISSDGKRLVLCDYFAAYEFVLPAKAKNFDHVWMQKAIAVDLGERKQGEAICYGANGKTIYATSEERPTPLIEVNRK